MNANCTPNTNFYGFTPNAFNYATPCPTTAFFPQNFSPFTGGFNTQNFNPFFQPAPAFNTWPGNYTSTFPFNTPATQWSNFTGQGYPAFNSFYPGMNTNCTPWNTVGNAISSWFQNSFGSTPSCFSNPGFAPNFSGTTAWNNWNNAPYPNFSNWNTPGAYSPWNNSFFAFNSFPYAATFPFTGSFSNSFNYPASPSWNMPMQGFTQPCPTTGFNPAFNYNPFAQGTPNFGAYNTHGAYAQYPYPAPFGWNYTQNPEAARHSTTGPNGTMNLKRDAA